MAERIIHMPEPIDNNGDRSKTTDPETRPVDFTQFRQVPHDSATIQNAPLPSEVNLRVSQQMNEILGHEGDTPEMKADRQAVADAGATADSVDAMMRANAPKRTTDIPPIPRATRTPEAPTRGGIFGLFRGFRRQTTS